MSNQENTRQDLLALRMAIQTEIDGYEFYIRAAEQASNARTQTLFQTIAQDEIGHRQWLEAQEASLKRDGLWLAEQPETWPKTQASVEGLPIFDEQHIMDISAHTSELTALRTAVLLEQDAINLYQRAAEQTQDGAGQKMYRFLADFEREHRRLLEAEYNFFLSAFRDEMGFAPF